MVFDNVDALQKWLDENEQSHSEYPRRLRDHAADSDRALLRSLPFKVDVTFDGSVWIATFRRLPVTYSSGLTLSEAVANAREAIADAFHAPRILATDVKVVLRLDAAASGPGWRENLAAACRGEGLSAAYQPIVDTVRGTVVGYEALARSPGFAEKNPEVWFAAARTHGQSAELEAAALRAALTARPALPPNCFAVDDAGTGYAGLRHLLALRPSLIKIDRELFQDVDRDEAKRALISMLGTFASRVDAWILAEGVERVEELDALVTLGVPLVQGYCLARPGPVWEQIDLDLAHRLASKPPVTHQSTIRDIVEPATTARSTATAAAAFEDASALDL